MSGTDPAGSLTARFAVPASHPCLPGHFPGRPVVPGVVLLDRVMEAARAAGLEVAGLEVAGLGAAGLGAAGLEVVATLPSAKFLRPVLPEEEVTLTLRRTPSGRVAFAGQVGGVPAFQGELG